MRQITLMETYLIEILRSEGITNEEILTHVAEKRVNEFEKYHESFDFTGLYAMEDYLAEILHKGYQVKFLTMPGLVNLLRLKYGKEPEKDFTIKETAIENLTLDKAEKADLETWLANNWRIDEYKDTISIVPRYSQA